MESSDSKNGASSLRDIIVTLPRFTIVALGTAALLGLLAALAAAAWAPDKEVRGAASSAAVLLLSLLVAVVAAVGVRRTSTRQIDELVERFLERTVLNRLTVWCRSASQTKSAYPFASVRLSEKPTGRSYAYFDLSWREAAFARLPAARVGVKMNVFNFEIISVLPLCCPSAVVPSPLTDMLLDRANLADIVGHRLLQPFFCSLQGAIEEGYAIRVSFDKPVPVDERTHVRMTLSVRQKLSVNFLTSPFLKRYFAEDAAIFIGVLYNELIASQWLHDSSTDPSG